MSYDKAGSKKDGQNDFLAALFFDSFFTLAVEKKDSKNSARKFFGPSCFVTALGLIP